MTLQRVPHTGIEVENLAKAVALHKSLGFEVANEFEKPDPKAMTAEDLSAFIRTQAENQSTYYLKDVTIYPR